MIELFLSLAPYFVTSTFTALVNVVSVIGFFITIYLMVSVRQIKNNFTSRIRVPELRKQLIDHTLRMNDFLNDYHNNRHRILTEMALMEPVLQGIKKRLGWVERSKVKEAIKKIKNYQSAGGPFNFFDFGASIMHEESVRSIYNLLQGIISELDQWEIDKKWSV